MVKSREVNVPKEHTANNCAIIKFEHFIQGRATAYRKKIRIANCGKHPYYREPT